MIKKLRVMGSDGDSVVEFDETNVKAVVEAEALFDRLPKTGSAVFAVNCGEGVADKKVTQFNELKQDNVVVKPIVGG